MDRFPTVGCLAESTVEEVLLMWSGLGYYRRARSLHRAAEIVNLEGSFPISSADWKKLPGVGNYTAGAIASQAFGEKVAVVDGNVERVLGRFLGLTEDLKSSSIRKIIIHKATKLLSQNRPGDSNQAVMELGALLCRPKNSHCEPCPLNNECQALKLNLISIIPRARKRKAREKINEVVLIVESPQGILLFHRSSREKVLASFQELPWVAETGDLLPAMRKRYGGEWRLGRLLGNVSHSVTHRDYRVKVFSGGLDKTPTRGKWSWLSREDIEKGPMTARMRKSLALLWL